MDCAGFERELAELLDGGAVSNAQERERSIRALEAHADDCDACAGCRDLLALLDRRDPESDPGQAYWDSFDRRVSERIRRETPRTGSSGRWWIAGAAAAVLLVVVGSWTIRRGPAVSSTTAVVLPATELPEELERMVEAAPGDALVQLEQLAGWGSSWDEAEAGGADAGLFPDVSGLDDEASQAFLRWLQEQGSES